MRLKSGNLLWPDLSPRPRDYPALPGDVFCDVLVVGAGVSGALTAWHLARAGFDVLVVDRRLPVSGSTPASTALLQYELDTTLIELRRLIGRECADRAYRRCGLALNDISKVVSSLDEDVGLGLRPSLYIAKSDHDIERLGCEAAAREQIGLPSHFIAKDQLRSRYTIDRAGAIVSHGAMEIDPYRFTIALLQSAVRQGVRIYRAPVELSRFDRHRIWLRSGESRVCAHHVVFATGYEIPRALQSRYCTLKSTYAIASDPLDPSLLWPQRALIWEASDPYLYLRTTA
ncbi:MAG TPA: FAD-dependent oxidoreductase, partial [Tepidisphaeraceae bacterium]|nr:FAD-dependent oxidoreductase [Tepidisphaeraceae bacterium]